MEEFLCDNETQTIINECPGCGATFEYDIETGKLKCGHCGTTKDIEKDETVERRKITDEIIKQGAEWKDTMVFSCDNCGARAVLQKNEANRKCGFCGSVNIIETKDLAGIKPDSVIPFQITADGAAQRFRKWLKGRWLAPRALKKTDVSENMNPIYTTCWSFTAKTESSYKGVLGRYVQQQHRDSKGNIQTQTTVKYFRVDGRLNQDYYDHMIQSGDKIPPATFNKIKPYDLKLISVYRQEYLTGIIAEHYTRNLETCFNDFSNFVRMDLRRKIVSRHNADVVQSLEIKTNYHDRKFNYTLLPLYISNYVFREKTYNFYINGASGLITGRYPKSKVKIFFLGLGAAILVGAAAAFAWWMGWF